VAVYRDLLHPVSDLEAAALAELSRRVTAVRMRVTIPGIVLSALAGFAAATAHITGYLAIIGRMADGSYIVSKGSIVFTTLAAVIAFAIPSALMTRMAHAMAVRGWRAEAKARFQLDQETVDELAQMFAPIKVRVELPDGD
jgi:hypothetical protein